MDQAQEPSDEPLASFRVAATSRWAHAVTLAVLVPMAVALVTFGRLTWIGVLFLVLVAVQAVTTAALWRWQVTSTERGVTIRRGIGPPRHIPWDRIVGVARRPHPRVELADDDDVMLGVGVSHRLLDRAAQHIASQAANRRR